MQAIAALKGEKGISAWVDWGKKKAKQLFDTGMET